LRAPLRERSLARSNPDGAEMNRFRRIEWALLLAVLTLVSPGVSRAADPEDALIKGISEFLLDRANDNYVYIFQRKLESNEVFKKYLPATYQVAKAGDLRSLLTNRDLWRTALRQDLDKAPENFVDRVVVDLKAFVKQLCPDNTSKQPEECKTVEDAVEMKIPKNAEARPKAREHGSAEPERASLAMTAFTESAQDQLKKRVLDGLKNDLDQINTRSCRRETAEEEKKRAAAEAEGKPTAARMYTSCVIQGLALLDALAHADYVYNCFLMGNWCWNNQRDKKVREENDDFDDFKRYALFFAQMADAAQTNDPERVKALLKSVTIPPVSFGIKREPHRTRVLITAYLGGAWARDKTDLGYERTFVIAAPIGFEISQARGSGNSLSLLVSPVDFGYPLSLKMQNSEATVRTSDIVVPSAYVLWGPKNYPFAGGVGYARVRNVDTDSREGRWLLFLGFDLPLFKLY
jgi:hypothetical protein